MNKERETKSNAIKRFFFNGAYYEESCFRGMCNSYGYGVVFYGIAAFRSGRFRVNEKGGRAFEGLGRGGGVQSPKR